MINTYKKKFTVIEAIVVLVILGVITAILLPILGDVRDSALRTANISNLKMISKAMNLYSMDNNGSLPYATNALNSRSLLLLLPYVSNDLEIFYPPHIFDENMNNATFIQYNSNPETIIPGILAGNTDIESGYAYTPLDASDNPLSFKTIESGYPIVTTFNNAYPENCYILYSDGSITNLTGEPI